jgi:hypothetical protein
MILFDNSIPRDWFDWTNASVGGVGLLLTIVAIVQATGAKAAAHMAGKSVQRHNAEVDFGTLTRLATELHGYVEAGRLSEARIRTSDLRSEMAVAIPHYKLFLGAKADLLKEKQVDLALVSDGLNRVAGEMSESERVRLLRITGAILEMLAGQCGELRSSVEKEVFNG